MYKIMDGNEACATVSYKFSEVAGIYPITPSSTMPELIDEWSSKGKLNYFNDTVKIVEMQSEAGAIGMVHGSLQQGLLSSTYTASQGLLLMIPNMYKIAGEMLPCVINVAARSLSTHALSILGDHQDIYATRSTGFAILASSSVQDVMDLTNVAYLSTIKGKLPFINFFDGFRTSHELQKIEVIDEDKVKNLIDYKCLNEFRNNSMQCNNICSIGTAQNDDIYFQNTESRNKYYTELEDIVSTYMDNINEITNKDYKPFNYYGSKYATNIIVAMGSVCETIKETIDNISGDFGLIEVHLYRPFSKKYFLDVLPMTVKKIAVLDRTKEAGSSGEPLYLDVKSIVPNDILVIGGRYGLSSKNTTPGMIKSIYDFLEEGDCFNGFTIGIDDDVTNLSLDYKELSIINNNYEILIYGYGSDGMVSASKDILKITGENSNAFVQGYFQYDSKKSGGVTKSHIRLGNEKIKSTYYIEKANLLVCTKDSYINKFNIIKEIKYHGKLVISTTKSEEEFNKLLSNEDKEYLINNKIRIYLINAEKLSNDMNLGNKINYMMELIVFNLSHIIDPVFAINKMKESITKKFALKSGDISEKNIALLDMAMDNLSLIEIDNKKYIEPKEEELTLFEKIDNRKGNDIPVSEFMSMPNGKFIGGTSKLEKRAISEFVPCFNKDNCIMCNLCSIVCPHGVIRPFLLDEEEKNKAPMVVKNKLMDANIKDKDYNYIISPSVKDCTGCNLCVNICPGKKGEKALQMVEINELEDSEEEVKYLFNNVKDKDIHINNVKTSQFSEPKFAFSGACAGCGETPYLKLLTQLFKDELIIANATGCSSIYGASTPSMPYSIPWASSLFEDNAEYGYGMKIADEKMKERIKKIIESNIDKVKPKYKTLVNDYLNNLDVSKELYDNVFNIGIMELIPLKEYIKKKTFFIVGGDGWAYDIGFSGIDHILANHENVNILVLDTEVYSNTGGQMSKSSRTGSLSKFSFNGKQTAKKDLAKIALTYPHVYVGTISLGANPNHTVKTLLEAKNYDGPSLIIAYCPCISHKIVSGMSSSIDEEKLATESGYFPLFRYNPNTKKFSLDSEADFDRYYEFIANEDRYRMLKKINPDNYRQLLEDNKNEAINNYNELKLKDNTEIE
ncbi:MAG: pyruvate:ferredoxin (flavodoxin) oxidoreductase [Bacilli bacterium]